MSFPEYSPMSFPEYSPMSFPERSDGNLRRLRYEDAASSHSARCLGSFVLLGDDNDRPAG